MFQLNAKIAKISTQQEKQVFYNRKLVPAKYKISAIRCKNKLPQEFIATR